MMNKITKYITTGAAALLMLMSVGAVQNNANASRKHYRNHVTSISSKKAHRSQRQNRKASRKNVNKRRARNNKNRRIRKNARRGMKRSHRDIRKHVNQLNRRRYHNNKVLKPRYQIIAANHRGNQALRKSGFVDGRILAKMGYSQDFRNLIFNKYAPNDKRAKLPNYMNPKASKKDQKLPSYNDVNKDFWIQGKFSLSKPWTNTKNPKVYKYNSKARGWQPAPRN